MFANYSAYEAFNDIITIIDVLWKPIAVIAIIKLLDKYLGMRLK